MGASCNDLACILRRTRDRRHQSSEDGPLSARMPGCMIRHVYRDQTSSGMADEPIGAVLRKVRPAQTNQKPGLFYVRESVGSAGRLDLSLIATHQRSISSRSFRFSTGECVIQGRIDPHAGQCVIGARLAIPRATLASTFLPASRLTELDPLVFEACGRDERPTHRSRRISRRWLWRTTR